MPTSNSDQMCKKVIDLFDLLVANGDVYKHLKTNPINFTNAAVENAFDCVEHQIAFLKNSQFYSSMDTNSTNNDKKIICEYLVNDTFQQ